MKVIALAFLMVAAGMFVSRCQPGAIPIDEGAVMTQVHLFMTAIVTPEPTLPIPAIAPNERKEFRHEVARRVSF